MDDDECQEMLRKVHAFRKWKQKMEDFQWWADALSLSPKERETSVYSSVRLHHRGKRLDISEESCKHICKTLLDELDVLKDEQP